MARTLKRNGPNNRSTGAPEKPFFDRLVDLRRKIEALNEDVKVVKAEAKEADLPIGPLELSVKIHLETEKQRNARLNKQAEAERILRVVLGEFVTTSLGEAAMSRVATALEAEEDA